MTSKVNIVTNGEPVAESVSAAVAARVRALRRAAGLTLDALSKSAGVSKGILVEIEKGSANPSIGTLCKVASAFCVSVADIVSVTDASPVRMVAKEAMPLLWTGPHGGSARLLAGTSGPDMLELWRWVMAPGETYESIGHPSGTMELFHVDAGVLTLVVGSHELILSAGLSAVAQTDVAHRYANHGPDTLTFTMAVNEPRQIRSLR